MTHELKCLAVYFQPTLDGRKTVELRDDDRHYCGGDTLVLKEVTRDAVRDDQTGYTGRTCRRRITHLTRGAPWLVPGSVALSIKEE